MAPGDGFRRTLDERDARVLLVAARLAHDSISRAAAAARQEAERRVAEAAAARKRSREMLDAAFRALEAEAREVKMRPAPPPQPPKKKTPKSTEANRDKDRLLKLNAMQQPALAFAAAAAAAAATSMPLPTPPPIREVKQESEGEPAHNASLQMGIRFITLFNDCCEIFAGSVMAPAREDRPALFGTLQS
jgi:hypothetical protein